MNRLEGQGPTQSEIERFAGSTIDIHTLRTHGDPPQLPKMGCLSSSIVSLTSGVAFTSLPDVGPIIFPNQAEFFTALRNQTEILFAIGAALPHLAYHTVNTVLLMFHSLRHLPTNRR